MKRDWPAEWGNYFKLRWYTGDYEFEAFIYIFRGDLIYFAGWIEIGSPL